MRLYIYPSLSYPDLQYVVGHLHVLSHMNSQEREEQ